MEHDKKWELSDYRIEQSEICIKSAKILIDAEDYKGAANRTYYAVYHAIRAIIALDSVEFKKHSGNISYFRQEYVKTGIFDVSLSETVTMISEIRNDSDYNDFYVISKDEVREQIKNAELFISDVRIYLHKRRSKDFE